MNEEKEFVVILQYEGLFISLDLREAYIHDLLDTIIEHLKNGTDVLFTTKKPQKFCF